MRYMYALFIVLVDCFYGFQAMNNLYINKLIVLFGGTMTVATYLWKAECD